MAESVPEVGRASKWLGCTDHYETLILHDPQRRREVRRRRELNSRVMRVSVAAGVIESGRPRTGRRERASVEL